ncbi:MAG TPA: carboxypeptidase regulatory-like domain-containing protein [Terriglobales bacterium]|nr:carboxypeptidase regulatory-like domain-containing protein [Terriglobales bacterium]
MRNVGLCLLFLLAVIMVAPPALAQADYATATLKGTVFDPQNKWIEGANITVKNPNTGFSRTTNSDANGSYVVPLLPPGNYELETQAKGFARALARFTVSIGQAAVLDVHMQLGAMIETVEVSANAEFVQVDQTQQANTLGMDVIAELPNVSRDFTDSIFTLPGVSRSEAPRAQNPGFSGFQSSGFSIGGSNGRNNLVTLDGGEGDYGSGQLRTPHVPLESIQEFQVNRSSFAAEFGFTTGTAINLVTKSGTNAWRGTAYAFFRDEHTDASNYFAPRSGDKAFEQNFVPGFSLGGPIIPNKLFFFTAYEFTKQDTPQFRSYSTSSQAQGIQSNAEQLNYVNGLMTSGDAALQGIGGQLMYLLTPKNFPNTSKLLDPNSGVFNDWKKFHNWVTRVDLQPNQSDAFSFRFSFMQDDASRMYVLDPLNSPDDATIQYWRDYTLLGNWNHIFSPKLVNQLRVQVVPSDTADVLVAAPNTTYLRIGSLGNFRGEQYEPYFCRQRRFQFEDSLALTFGKHTMKFGGSYRPVSYFVHDELWFGGQFQFYDGTIPIVAGIYPLGSAEASALVQYNLTHGLPALGTAGTNLSALQSYALGIPVAFRQGYGNPNWSDWGHYFGVYAQDSWKITNNLTMDFGGRIDYDAEPAPLPSHLFFSPRLGIAWNPDGEGKTVVRLGGGMFVAPVNFFISYIVNLLDDSGRYINQVATNLSLNPPDTTIVKLWKMGIASGKLPFRKLNETDLAAVGLPVGPGLPGRIVLQPSDDYTNPYSIQASLSVQRQLAHNTSFDVAYHMYRGLHLQLPRDGNVKETGVVDDFIGPIYAAIDPTLVQREIYSSIGKSIYHGLTTSLSRRTSRLQMQVNYSFSKTIDDNTDFNNDFMPFRPTRMELERAISSFNIKHNFVANAVYFTPFKRGGFLSTALADITISPIVSLRSGIPFTVRVPGMQNGTKGESLYARPWHAPRNSGLGPAFFSMDLRLTKSFYLGKNTEKKLQFLAEGTNILNHTNFSAVNDVFPADRNPFQLGPYNIDLLNGPYNFQGTRELDRSQPLGFKAAFDPRQIQFGLKFIF